jgi:ribulose-phosphate 3-epimerase
LQAIRALGKRAGLALNPATDLGMVEYCLDLIDLVLVMSVNPGFGGQAFIPAAVEKVRKVKALIGARPIRIELDGGINPQTAGLATAAGADTLVAGSAVFAGGSKNYATNIVALRAAATQGMSSGRAA